MGRKVIIYHSLELCKWWDLSLSLSLSLSLILTFCYVIRCIAPIQIERCHVKFLYYCILISVFLQTLFNPNKTVIKMFVVMYDLSDMPPQCQTFLRQRTVYMPVEENSSQPSYLRYLIHLRWDLSQTFKISHVRLHSSHLLSLISNTKFISGEITFLLLLNFMVLEKLLNIINCTWFSIWINRVSKRETVGQRLIVKG